MSINASALPNLSSLGVQSISALGAVVALIASLRKMILEAQHSIAFALQPATPSQKHILREHLRGVLQINRLACEMEETQPNQAAELHRLSSC